MQRETKYNGLHKRDSYEGLVNYLQGHQEIIRYPDRWAKRVRESPYLTQLDAEGVMEIRDQQEEEMKEQEKEFRVRKVAEETGMSANHLRSMEKESQVDPPALKPSNTIDAMYDDGIHDVIDAYSKSFAKQANNKRDSNAQTVQFKLRKQETQPDYDGAVDYPNPSSSSQSIAVGPSSGGPPDRNHPREGEKAKIPVGITGRLADTYDYYWTNRATRYAKDKALDAAQDAYDKEHGLGKYREPSPWEILAEQAKEAQKEARDRESAAYWDQKARERDARLASYSEPAEPELPSTDYGQASASSSYIPRLLPRPAEVYDLTAGDEPDPDATVIAISTSPPVTPPATPPASSSWVNTGHSLWGPSQTKEVKSCWSQARGDQIMGGFGVF